MKIDQGVLSAHAERTDRRRREAAAAATPELPFAPPAAFKPATKTARSADPRPSFGFPPPARKRHATTVSVVNPAKTTRTSKPAGKPAKKRAPRRSPTNRGS